MRLAPADGLLPADEVADWHCARQIPAVVEAFDWYKARLRANNAVDFDDLLSLCVALLRDEVRSQTSMPILRICPATQGSGVKPRAGECI